MGLMKQGNLLYLNVSYGFLRNKTEGIESRAYTGYLESIDRTDDEFEGKKIPKIVLIVKDNESDQRACIKFTEKSWYAFSFFSRIVQCNIEKPITIGASGSDDSKVSFCWMKQGKVKIKKTSVVPYPQKVNINNEEVTDWGPCIEAYTNIMTEVNLKCSSVEPPEIVVEQDGKVPPVIHTAPGITKEMSKTLGLANIPNENTQMIDEGLPF